MDRDLDSSVVRSRWIRRILYSAATIVLIGAILLWGPAWIRPSIKRAQVRTSVVEMGSVDAAVTATGTVVPEFEQVLSSPIDARVVRILKRPGSLVAAGEPILELDVSASVLAVQRFDQQLALKENEQAGKRLDLQATLINVQRQWEIKKLELEASQEKLSQNRKLFADGLVSAEELRRSELEEAKARAELRHLEESRANAGRITETLVQGLALEMDTLRKEKREAERLLELATTRSDRSGVLTWVVPEEGATVRRGDVVARIADLRSFRVEARVSEIHAKRLAPGITAQLRVGESDRLEGVVESVLPTIENGVITVLIGLKERSHPLLRANLRVDVLLIMEQRNRVLRIRKGPGLTAEGSRDVFVLRGDNAVRTPARFGVASFDHYEVVDGLLEGDEVIISDMSDYVHLRELRVR